MRGYLLIFILYFYCFTILTGCKDYSEESILWLNAIETGTDIEKIKTSQPGFIKINWEKPDTVNYKLYYLVTIKGNPDILNKTHHLVFMDGRFQGCSHHHK